MCSYLLSRISVELETLLLCRKVFQTAAWALESSSSTVSVTIWSSSGPSVATVAVVNLGTGLESSRKMLHRKTYSKKAKKLLIAVQMKKGTPEEEWTLKL